MKKWKNAWRLLPLSLLAFLLAGCGEENLTALDPKGPQAAWIFDNMMLSVYVMTIVSVFVFGVFFIILFRFRRKPGDDAYPKQVEGSTALEITWTAIPILLLCILAVPTIAGTFMMSDVEPEGEHTVKIKVTAHQFWWQFDYEDAGFTAGQDVYIPVGEKVLFDLESDDVMHSFWVPALGGKKDTNPGMTNFLWLDAKEEGVFQGRCAELCGDSHALMDFKVHVVSQEEYDQWVTKMTKGTNKPAENAVLADQGAEIFQLSCVNCHAVDGKGGPVGPDLTNFGDRKTVAGILKNDKDGLTRWLSDPDKEKPGNLMVIPKLEENQVDALVEYLHSLKRE